MIVASMTMIILRRNLEHVVKSYTWGLMFGRRKTGKTFYMRNRGVYDHYFVVSRSGAVLSLTDHEVYTPREFLRVIPHLLDGHVVVDEFHRLGEDFYALLQGLSGEGHLMLITSTLHLARELLSRGSPLLGLFEEHRVGLISPLDLLAADISVEQAVLYQEPALIGKDLPSRSFVRGLVGEVFNEEERRLTRVYEGILAAVAAGKNRTGEISSYLFARGLIDKDDPSLIQSHLRHLVEMGILERVAVFSRRKRFFYRHVSPALDFGYYLNEKYGWFDTNVPRGFVVRVWKERIPMYVEIFVERFFSELYGHKPVKILVPEVDIALLRFKKLVLVGEVKWRMRLTKADVRTVENKFSQLEKTFGEVERRVLVVPDASAVPETDLDVWDEERLKNEAKKAFGS